MLSSIALLRISLLSVKKDLNFCCIKSFHDDGDDEPPDCDKYNDVNEDEDDDDDDFDRTTKRLSIDDDDDDDDDVPITSCLLVVNKKS